METEWNDGDRIECALCIGDVSDAEGERVAVITVTALRVVSSVKVDGERKWFLEPLELRLVEDTADDSKHSFAVVWRNDSVESDERKASKRKAFNEMVTGFGPDAKVESYDNLVSDFLENRLIEWKDDMITDFDAPTSIPGQDKGRGAMRPVRHKYEYISERSHREKGIWQFVATDVSKKDEDERLEQMVHIVRMGQLMLDNGKKTGPKKSLLHLN